MYSCGLLEVYSHVSIMHHPGLLYCHWVNLTISLVSAMQLWSIWWDEFTKHYCPVTIKPIDTFAYFMGLTQLWHSSIPLCEIWRKTQLPMIVIPSVSNNYSHILDTPSDPLHNSQWLFFYRHARVWGTLARLHVGVKTKFCMGIFIFCLFKAKIVSFWIDYEWNLLTGVILVKAIKLTQTMANCLWFWGLLRLSWISNRIPVPT